MIIYQFIHGSLRHNSKQRAAPLNSRNNNPASVQKSQPGRPTRVGGGLDPSMLSGIMNDPELMKAGRWQMEGGYFQGLGWCEEA